MPEPIENTFVTIGQLPTYGIRQWEHFKINGIDMLAAANSTAQSRADFDNFNIFKFENNVFNTFQLLAASNCYYNDDAYYLKYHAFGWRHFQVGGSDWIAIANNYRYDTDNSGRCNTGTKIWATNSYAYQWDTEKEEFKPSADFLSMMTDSALMWESYSTATDSYLAVVGQGNGGGKRVMIFKWDNGKFQLTNQPALDSIGVVQSVESFKDNNNQVYLVMSQKDAGENTLVYMVNSATGELSLYQRLAASSYAREALVFTDVNNNKVLLFGYETNDNVEPIIYTWEFDNAVQKNQFVAAQSLEKNTFKYAQAWSHYRLDGKDYVAVAMGEHGARVYAWDGQKLVTRYPYIVWSNPEDNIVSLTAFVVDDSSAFVALAKYVEGQKTTSPILRWNW